MKKPIQPWQITLIKIAQNALCQAREDYLLLLADLFGSHIKSCTSLTFDQANLLIADYKRKGFVVISTKPEKLPAKTRTAGAIGRRLGLGRSDTKDKVIRLVTAEETYKLNAIAALIAWRYEDGLTRFLETRMKIKGGAVRTSQEAFLAIEALKKMLENHMKKLHGENWWGMDFSNPAVNEYIARHCPLKLKFMCRDRIKMLDVRYSCKACGWVGKELKKVFCLTNADEWWECPECGASGAAIDHGSIA